MKRLFAAVLALAFLLSAMPVSICYAGDYQDTPIDQAGDWFATLGKKGFEKDQILAERKAARVVKHAEKMAKQAAKDAEKAGKDMKKKFGL